MSSSTYAEYYGGSESGTVVDGAIVSPLVIGDDYLSTNGRSLIFRLATISNVTPGVATCSLAGRHRYRNGLTWLVTGVLTIAAGQLVLTFDLPGTATAALVPGEYIYTVMVTDDSGKKITTFASLDRPVDLIHGQGATSDPIPC